VKKIIFILIMITTVFILYSKESQIELNNGEKITIAIPENQEDLEKAFLKAMKAYKNTELNLTFCTEKLEESNDKLKASNKTIDNLLERNTALYEVLKTRKKTSWVRPYVLAGIYYDQNRYVNGDIGIGIMLLDWVGISAVGYFPDFGIGIQMQVYISK
jgi:hypothetical protein